MNGAISRERKEARPLGRQRQQYGSTGTISTELNTLSSSSSTSLSQESSTTQPGLTVHGLSLDLSLASSNDSVVLTGHSRMSSSFSDISEEGGYYDRAARHRHRSRNACNNFFETTLFTITNFKLIISVSIWFISYMIMGIFGGSVAYMHFQRSDRDTPDPLPDFGYDAIPYWCPSIPHIPHGNVQSIVLVILYALILTGAVIRWEPRYHPKTGSIIWGGDGRLILQHLCHLNCLIFLTRTSTVGLTGLPQPNPKCVDQQHLPVTFGNALRFVMGRGFPPHACGDLIYSGHVGCTLICMAVLHRHGFLRNKVVATLVWMVAFIGIYFTISCRSHYSVDVMLAFYFGYFLPEWYFNRSDGRVRGRISKWIRRVEVQPRDLEQADDHNGDQDLQKLYDSLHYPSNINI